MTDGEILDRGLAAAFGREPRSDSVLRRLGLDGSVALATTELPSTAPAPVPDDVVEASSTEGRYEVRGEIARGGVGMILEGRDVELGRDVAVKVLRPELAKSEQIVMRFLEEAQVGGQLQHPGITPVYDVGLLDDQRPYFAMKLVRGETLSALIEERNTSKAASAHLLRIFAQVCQTVAYAHARGVIHRDLKPENIMVGAFGEVQVMDWGFAKVLARGGLEDERTELPDLASIHTVRTDSGGRESQLGSVMGTPSYMPPEQARGQVDRLDERSDVFSLGAILLEILTGEPPYPVARDTILRAAQAELDDALARLAVVDPDLELATLCRDCLAVDRADRPRDASEVAERLEGHLAHLQERALAMARDAAASRVAARGAARARRLTRAIVTSLLLAVVLGGAGFLWARTEQAARDARERSTFDAAVAELDRRAGVAEAIETDGRHGWAERVAAFDHALEAWDEAQPLAPDTDERLGAHHDALVAGRAAAQVGADRAAADEAVARRLDEIRALETTGFDSTRPLQRALHEYGIDLAEGEFDDLEARISSSWIRREVVAALEKVARESGGYEDPASPLGLRVLSLLERVDADPLRSAIRQAGRAGDLVRLVELAESKDPGLFEEHVSNRLAMHLLQAEDVESERRLLREDVRRRPQGDWTHLQLARSLLGWEPQDPVEAEAWLRAAQASHPESLLASRWLGSALDKQGRTEEALDAWADGFRRDPAHHLTWDPDVAKRLRASGRLANLLESLRREAADRPDDPMAAFRLGGALEAAERMPEAIEAYTRSVELDDEAQRPRLRLAVAALADERWNLAIEHYDILRAQRPDNPWLYYLFGRALMERDEIEAALDAFDEVIRLQPSFTGVPWFRAWCNLRLNHVDEAIAGFEFVARRTPQWSPVFYQIGLTRLRAGRTDAALAPLERSMALDPEFEPARRVLAYVRLATAQYDQGRQLLEEHFERTPDTLVERASNEAVRVVEIAREHPIAPGRRRPDLPPSDLIHFANLAYTHGCFLLALDAYDAAFVGAPEMAEALGPYLIPVRHMTSAARAAGLLVSGWGREAHLLDEEGRALWRGRALQWMQRDVALWKEAIARGDTDLAARGLDVLFEDLDVGPLREPDLVKRLPVGEREAWQALWAEARALRESLR